LQELEKPVHGSRRGGQNAVNLRFVVWRIGSAWGLFPSKYRLTEWGWAGCKIHEIGGTATTYLEHLTN
jgi:hypothetical protein